MTFPIVGRITLRECVQRQLIRCVVLYTHLSPQINRNPEDRSVFLDAGREFHYCGGELAFDCQSQPQAKRCMEEESRASLSPRETGETYRFFPTNQEREGAGAWRPAR